MMWRCLSISILMIRLCGAQPVVLEESHNDPVPIAEDAHLTPPKSDRIEQLTGDERHTLWVPGDYQHNADKVDVLVHFHGSPEVVRSSARLAGLNCVVINIAYAGLSSVYRIPFSNDRARFQSILDEALAALQADSNFGPDTKWGQLAISSFSAGFAGVRELLKTPAYFARIDGLLMVDSLYCGYVGDGTDSVQEGVVHPGLMSDFVRFAVAAAKGEKVMIVTHCMQPTPGYASTQETADYLLGKLDLTAQAVDMVADLPSGAGKSKGTLRLHRQAVRKGFSLYGSPGLGITDHGEHLRSMAFWLPILPLDHGE